MPSQHTLLRAALAELAVKLNDYPEAEEVVFRTPTFNLRISIETKKPIPVPASSAQNTTTSERHLTPMERDILRVCATGKPKRARRIATEINGTYGPHLRELLSGLVQDNILERSSLGYMLARQKPDK